MVAKARYCLRGHDTWDTGRYPCNGGCCVCARAKSVQQRAEHPVRLREYKRKWRLANPEKQKSAEAGWRQNNRLYDTLRGASRRAIQGNTRVSQAMAEEVIDYYGDKCVYCGGPSTGFDHLQPLSKGGLHTVENLAPCCQSCNSVKRDRPIWTMLGREEVIISPHATHK